MSTRACSSSSSNDIQFFVRTMSGKSLVLRANPNDTIQSIHEKIHSATGIPLDRQRLVYGSKQLESHNTLFHYNISNNSTLHVVARMHSTNSYTVGIHDLLYASREGKCFESALSANIIQKLVENSCFYRDVFVSSCLREALVKLYISPYDGNKECAQNLIQGFINSDKNREFAPIVLHFCKSLHAVVPRDDPLYIFCRSSLGSMLNTTNIIAVQDIIPFVNELATKLSHGWVSSIESTGPSLTDVHEFKSFSRYMVNAIIDSKALDPLYSLYYKLLETMRSCLNQMEDNINKKVKRGGGCDQYLPILRFLHNISQLYEGTEETFWTTLKPHKVAFCYLIVRFVKRGDKDWTWILDHKYHLTNFESRTHLVMMLLPEVTKDYANGHNMRINRSNLLTESFESIKGANLDKLRRQMSIRFTNEEANGPGVLREWFVLVCHALFNPQNALFLACPTDGKRIFPNPASKVNWPLDPEYYRFAGRLIALALMHKIQVGIVFGRAFFLQLAGINVSLEDIKDADPYLYSSCKQILKMDPYVVDQDVLGLTFAWEFEEFGVRKVVELLPNGKHIVVNSKNRKEYINLIIAHQFVTSIAEQVSQFSQGFVDIVGNEENMKLCFEILELEYLDGMLRGSESDISVDDWKAHTGYKGYKETDPQIDWFWKIVREMSAEQQKVLLFFWTSVKYLPVEGFRGLSSRLYIIKSDERYDHLPSSHTCFYQICIPAYPSMAVMQKRLNIITQEYVGFGFGKV
ncbi:ubiquitin protein ligase 5 [Artemisia annua]|uniref:HECT-type E3 ubiquitin transferase n=1 Tax=Artemisia annua TaxID=35608 RepID=A0A2U1N3F2_ARTAN|nr:ubiquitin protein ligase 5 [Artemisia annua]